MLKKFWNEEEGMGTVEIVLIIGALIAIALIFRNTVIAFAKDVMKRIFNGDAATDPTKDTGSVYGGK